MSELIVRIKKKTNGEAALTCQRADGSVTWQQSPGGLVTAMESVMSSRPGAWVGWSGDPGEAAACGISNRPL